MYKLDLHTHSTKSRDGGISSNHYAHVIDSGILDYIAVTDHNHVSMALELKKRFGSHIIVGEEVSTNDGEIIGLYLSKKIPKNMSAKKTVQAIKDQQGLVYIPHPFETVRSGISKKTLTSIIDDVDIIEVYNGRAIFQNKGPEAATAARIHNKPGMASSDAHGLKGLGTTYANIDYKPTHENLVKQLHTAKLSMVRPPLKTLLYPKANRIRKRWARD